MGGWVVCPEELNGGLEALLFDFEELLLWNVATGDEPIWHPPLIDMDLSGMEYEATNTTLVPPPFWPSNLHVTLPWPSTYTAKGPWNGYSRLPPQPQPPSLSIAHLGGCCHLQPLGLCPPPEQKIHSAWRGQTQLSQIRWPPLHRHSCMQSCQKTSLASS